MSELLAQIPAAVLDDRERLLSLGDSAMVWIGLGDHLGASELAGLDRPPTDERDALIGWHVDLHETGLVDGSSNHFGFAFQSLDGFDEEIGFHPLEIDTLAGVNLTGFTVVDGDLSLSPDLADLGDGVFSAGSGEDYEASAENSTDARRLGSPLRLAAAGDRVAMSLSTPMIEEWIADGGPTLLVEPSISAAAAALDSAHVVSAEIIVADFVPVEIDEPAANDPDDTVPSATPALAVPFDALAVGATAVGGRAAAAIVYVYADEALAEEAVPEIDDRWRTEELRRVRPVPLSDLFDIVSVEQIGTTVLVIAAEVEPGDLRVAFDMLGSAEPLMRHL